MFSGQATLSFGCPLIGGLNCVITAVSLEMCPLLGGWAYWHCRDVAWEIVLYNMKVLILLEVPLLQIPLYIFILLV